MKTGILSYCSRNGNNIIHFCSYIRIVGGDRELQVDGEIDPVCKEGCYCSRPGPSCFTGRERTCCAGTDDIDCRIMDEQEQCGDDGQGDSRIHGERSRQINLRKAREHPRGATGRAWNTGKCLECTGGEQGIQRKDPRCGKCENNDRSVDETERDVA